MITFFKNKYVNKLHFLSIRDVLAAALLYSLVNMHFLSICHFRACHFQQTAPRIGKNVIVIHAPCASSNQKRSRIKLYRLMRKIFIRRVNSP